MIIRWSKNRVAEQHLEGDCRDSSKLTIECHGVEAISAEQTATRFLRVHHVESQSDGVLRIYLDLGKET
jgi:hypothetical protein